MALVDFWGVETGIVAANAGPDTVQGTPAAAAPPTGFGHGSYCMVSNPVGASGASVLFTRSTITIPTLVVGFAMHIAAFGTSAGQDIAIVKALGTAGANRFIKFGVDGGTKKLYFTNGAGVKTSDPVARNVGDILWIDLKFDLSGATWAFDWQVNGVQPAALPTEAEVSSQAVYFQWGGNNAGGPYTINLDDLVFGNASGDFPIGNTARVIPLGVRAGAGSIDTAASVNISQFHDETAAAVGSGSGGSVASLPFGAGSRHIAWDGGSPGTTDRVYAFLFDTAETASARLLRAYAEFYNADGSTSANTFRVAANSGATSTDLFNGSVAVAQANIKRRSALLTAPGGGWTPSAVNALEASWGAGSSNNNAGQPALATFIAEALYTGSVASLTLSNRTPVITKVTVGTATSINVTLPASMADGEVLSVIIGCADDTITDITGPSQWTKRVFGTSPDGGGQAFAWFTKSALATDSGTSPTFNIVGGGSNKNMVAVATSVYDSGTGAALQFDQATIPTEDTVGPALVTPAVPAPSAGPCAILSAVVVDQSAGTEPVFGSVTTDSGGSVTKIADSVESGTFLSVAVAIEVQSTPLGATHTFNYTGGGTSTRGGLLGSIAIVPATGGVVPPAVPTGLAVIASDYSQVTLSWNSSSDGRAVGYNVYRDGVVIGQSSTTSFQDITVSPSTSYTYTIDAFDADGNTSAQTSGVNVTTGATPASIGGSGLLLNVTDSSIAPSADTVAPSTPTGVTVISNQATQVSFNWNASTDNIGVTGYRIYRNGSLIATLSAGILNYTDSGVVPSTTYSYRVQAFDAAGNSSAQSTAVQVTTPASGSSTPTFDSVTVYAQALPVRTPNRVLVANTYAEFKSQLSAAQPGDRIDCSQATWSQSGQHNITKSGTAAAPIEIIFGPGCKWTGGLNTNGGGPVYYCIYWQNCSYLNIFCSPGSTMTSDVTNGCSGMAFVNCRSVICYWHGTIGPLGGGGIQGIWGASPGIPYTWKGTSRQAGTVDSDFYFGDVTKVGTNLGLGQATGHTDPSTGLHGCMFADSPYGIYNTRIALRAHDLDKTDAIQWGASPSYANDCIRGCTLILDARRLNKISTQQFPQGVTIWGTRHEDNVMPYLYVEDCQGAGLMIDTSVPSGGLSTTVVQFARGVRCLLDSGYRSRMSGFGFPSTEVWPGEHGESNAEGITYQDVQP